MNARLDRRRRRASVALVVVTALLLAAAAVSWYAWSALVDERDFSSRTAAALDDSDLRTVMADRVVGALTRSVAPDLQAVRPLLVSAVAALADTSTFRRVFARAVSDRHRALINGERLRRTRRGERPHKDRPEVRGLLAEQDRPRAEPAGAAHC